MVEFLNDSKWNIHNKQNNFSPLNRNKFFPVWFFFGFDFCSFLFSFFVFHSLKFALKWMKKKHVICFPQKNCLRWRINTHINKNEKSQNKKRYTQKIYFISWKFLFHLWIFYYSFPISLFFFFSILLFCCCYFAIFSRAKKEKNKKKRNEIARKIEEFACVCKIDGQNK